MRGLKGGLLQVVQRHEMLAFLKGLYINIAKYVSIYKLYIYMYTDTHTVMCHLTIAHVVLRSVALDDFIIF